uniref:F-box protein 46 n=1 Tax=Latimeria chalumnae TaxID=7897 RepID=H3AEL9_LATCH
APSANQVEDGRVLLDTWYVIKPGNTKEKIAFFVAHQCSNIRANTMKVKGNWGSDCSKAKRRRRSHDPSKAKTSQVKTKGACKEAEDVCLCRESRSPTSSDSNSVVCETDLLSVAEMVALVEQRTALALQSCTTPCSESAASEPAPVQVPTPVVLVSSNEQPECSEKKPVDSNKVAEAIAHFESQQQRERNGLRRNCNSQHSPGEVRIAFRVSSMDSRSPTEAGAINRPGCMFMTCSGSANGARSKEKITCDLYQLVSPSNDSLPNNVDLLLASASPNPDLCNNSSCSKADVKMGGEGQAHSVKMDAVPECRAPEKKDSTENVKEETVCLTVSSPTREALCAACEDPPPGQLFFLHAQPQRPEENCEIDNSLMDSKNNNSHEKLDTTEGSGSEQDQSDTSLCRLYRHVSHDFLEIRFKIQRLLEPRQYMLLLPDHILVNIFAYLPTRSLAALKCSCHHFKDIIETYTIHATDSKWNRDPLYMDDPCKQCKKRYEKGDVSLCRWHPKPYHYDLPYGRSYWMCCRQTDKDTPGCRVGLHDNNWVQPC